jgi:peptidoglycan/xylan/chitin deacetylase (PgdA/CDA1 family)
MNRKWIRKLKHFFEKKAIVLMYHRIADFLPDPFELAVSPSNFEEHLQVLKNNFSVLPVNEFVNQLRKSSLLSNNVCITFDDGYADNYFAARPLLEKYQCPATFFIATGFTNNTQCFWWDELQHLLLNNPNLPSIMAVDTAGNLVDYKLDNDGALTKKQLEQQKNWLFTDPPLTQRCELFTAFWKQLKPLPFAEQQQILMKLKRWAGNNISIDIDSLAMTDQQLRDIADNPLFDIGIHTNTHPSLPLLSRNIQFQEISECKGYLEENLGKRINTISYPYGDYNELTLSIVKDKAIKGAFTTTECLVTKRTDPLRIGRFQVKNWSGKEFQRHLTAWFKSY